MPQVFASSAYDIAGCTLAPMTEQAAQEVAPALAKMDPWVRLGIGEEALRTYFAADDDGGFRYAIEVDSAMAGAVVVRAPWLRGPYLEFIGITPRFQGKGLGGAILSWMESCARAAGQANLWVLTSVFNENALRFYEGFGFVKVAVLEELIANDLNEVMLRKRLD